jgi:hypothetical protein
MVDSLAASSAARARLNSGPGEWRIEGARVRPEQRARVIEQIWNSLSTDLHPSAAPLLDVRFEGQDAVLVDPLGDGTLHALAGQGARRGRRLPLPLLLTLRAALIAGCSAVFHADFRGLRLASTRLTRAVALFGGQPKVLLSAFEPVDDGRLRAHDFSPHCLARLIVAMAIEPESVTSMWRGCEAPAIPAPIAKLLSVLEPARDLADACAAIRSASIELVGGALPRREVLEACAPFTPWGMIGTPARDDWQERLEDVLCELGARPLAFRLRQRRRAQRESDRQLSAPHASAPPKSAETPEILLRRGLDRIRERQIAGDLPAALGTCRELARDFAHSPEPWLALAELGALTPAPSGARLFACAEAIATARGTDAVVERACRSSGFGHPRELARAFDAAGLRAFANWLVAA